MYRLSTTDDKELSYDPRRLRRRLFSFLFFLFPFFHHFIGRNVFLMIFLVAVVST